MRPALGKRDLWVVEGEHFPSTAYGNAEMAFGAAFRQVGAHPTEDLNVLVRHEYQLGGAWHHASSRLVWAQSDGVPPSWVREAGANRTPAAVLVATFRGAAPIHYGLPPEDCGDRRLGSRLTYMLGCANVSAIEVRHPVTGQVAVRCDKDRKDWYKER